MGSCPDQGSNLPTILWSTMIQPTEPRRPGWFLGFQIQTVIENIVPTHFSSDSEVFQFCVGVNARERELLSGRSHLLKVFIVD